MLTALILRSYYQSGQQLASREVVVPQRLDCYCVASYIAKGNPDSDD